MVLRYLLLAASVCSLLVVPAAADPQAVQVYFLQDGSYVAVERFAPAEIPAFEAVVRAFVSGPNAQEEGWGLISPLPDHVSVQSVALDQGRLSIDLSPEVRDGLDDASLSAIFDAFRANLLQFPEITEIKLMSKGILLSDYLEPAPDWTSPPPPEPQSTITAVGLGGTKITIGPSHGLLWTGSVWGYQRPQTCGLGDDIREDLNSTRLMQFLHQYLSQDGAQVYVPRTLDQSLCCHAASGNTPWWKMGARYWLESQGLPSSVWDSSTSDSNDDIRARPLYADYVGSDIYISHHTNAYNGSASGTITFYDFAMEHPAHETNSQRLANNIQSAVCDAIETMYDATWYDRGTSNSNGAYGEIRIPNRPACLIELAFHDNCSKDALYLTDNYFRSLSEWGLYKGVCDYFGRTPTWDKFSYEIVSDTIPTNMLAGRIYNVSITLRNRGVLWNSARNFRLGAVGDSDPFTGVTRISVSGEIRPGQTYTFSFQMQAPNVGTYTSDWRMTKDTQWFGPTLVKTIEVFPSIDDPIPPTTPTGLTALVTGPNTVLLGWNPSTDNIGIGGYKIYRGAAQIGTSGTSNYTDNLAPAGSTLPYQVQAYDVAGNESGRSNYVVVTTPPASDLIVDNPAATFTGTWTTASSSSDKYGDDYRWTSSAASSTAVATWRPNVSVAGLYDVYVWYPEGSNRSVAAPYTVNYDGGSQTANVNQMDGGGQWNLIASDLPFAGGTAGHVTLHNGTGEASKVVLADAIMLRFKQSRDLAPPTGVAVTDEGAFTPSLDTLKASWSAATDVGGAGIDRYEYAIGASPGAQDVKGWASNGFSQTVTASSLSLVEGQSYYVSVRAVDAGGLTGPAGSSNGILVAPGVAKIGQAWSLEDAVALSLRDKLVTAVQPGFFWLEESDRSAAVKVFSSAPVSQGDLVSIAGILTLAEQRLMIGDVTIASSSGNPLPDPLSMKQAALGGMDVNPLTPGVTGSSTMYNAGLLVRCWGAVTHSDTSNPDNQFFYFDDGSGLTDGSGHVGTKVLCGSTAPPAAGFVLVTGLVEVVEAGSARVPILIIREADDIDLL